MQKPKTQPLSEETIGSLQRLGGILMKITHRLVREGKAKIENGKIIWQEGGKFRGNKNKIQI